MTNTKVEKKAKRRKHQKTNHYMYERLFATVMEHYWHLV